MTTEEIKSSIQELLKNFNVKNYSKRLTSKQNFKIYKLI